MTKHNRDRTSVHVSVIQEEGAPKPIDKGPGRYQPAPHPLEEKIQAAIDCIEADYKKESAIRFLRNTKAKLDKIQRPSRKCQAMQSLIETALADYGHYNEETP